MSNHQVLPIWKKNSITLVIVLEEIPDPNTSPGSDDHDTTFPGGKVINIIGLIANLSRLLTSKILAIITSALNDTRNYSQLSIRIFFGALG